MRIKKISLNKTVEYKFDCAMREFISHYNLPKNLFSYEKQDFDVRSYDELMFRLEYVPTGKVIFYYDSDYNFQIAPDALNDEEFSKIVEFNLLPKFKEYGKRILKNILPVYRCRLFNLPVRILSDKVVFNDEGLTTYHDLLFFANSCHAMKFNIDTDTYALLLSMIEVEEVTK